MTTNVPTRTTTQVFNETESLLNAIITCEASMNDDGTTTPSIYQSMVLEESSVVDAVNGAEGELLLLSDETNPGSIDENGDLTLTLENDDPDKYSINTEEGELEYEE